MTAARQVLRLDAALGRRERICSARPTAVVTIKRMRSHPGQPLCRMNSPLEKTALGYLKRRWNTIFHNRCLTEGRALILQVRRRDGALHRSGSEPAPPAARGLPLASIYHVRHVGGQADTGVALSFASWARRASRASQTPSCCAVIPAKAGIHCTTSWKSASSKVDSHLRRNDKLPLSAPESRLAKQMIPAPGRPTSPYVWPPASQSGNLSAKEIQGRQTRWQRRPK